LDGKYKICRENCPVPTIKELEVSVPESESLPRLTIAPLEQPVLKPQLLPQQPESTVIETQIQSSIAFPTFDIYFDFGMSRPNKEGRKSLLRFAKSIELRENAKIELLGKTDDIGTQSFNRNLAHERALYVQMWLKSHGVREQIAITAKEECCRAAPYDRRELALKTKRSVSIILRH
jgi:outer membrane protein OmpA-like peptidoglycan-associated protein